MLPDPERNVFPKVLPDLGSSAVGGYQRPLAPADAEVHRVEHPQNSREQQSEDVDQVVPLLLFPARPTCSETQRTGPACCGGAHTVLQVLHGHHPGPLVPRWTWHQVAVSEGAASTLEQPGVHLGGMGDSLLSGEGPGPRQAGTRSGDGDDAGGATMTCTRHSSRTPGALEATKNQTVWQAR